MSKRKKNKEKKGINKGRRIFVGAAAGAACLSSIPPAPRFLSAKPLLAQTNKEHRFVACRFGGGWDILLGADPRDPARSYEKIDLGTELLAAEFKSPIAASIGGRETLLGPLMKPIVDAGHLDVMTVFRGVNMNTVSHPRGTAYSNTGQQPAGASARGASLGTMLATLGDAPLPMPNVSISMPSYSADYGALYKGVRVNKTTEIAPIIGAYQRPFDDSLRELLAQAQKESRSCIRLSTESPANEMSLSRARVSALQARKIERMFDFSDDSLPELKKIQSIYGITKNDSGTMAKAATAAQLITQGISRSVSMSLTSSLDTHSNWAANQTKNQGAGWAAVAALLTHLREDDPNLEHTTLVLSSDFGRTPKINGTQGRDHWFANAFVVFGGGLKPGLIGATAVETLDVVPIDFATGLPSEDGEILRPEHIYATIGDALGVDIAAFRTSPVKAWQRG